MRTTCVCLVVGLVLLVAWTSEAHPQALTVPLKCCFNFIDFPIPSNKVKHVEQTSQSCPIKAVLVTTERGEFCVKPNAPWLKKIK
ncbi:C-C motif chemokine 22-like [Myxocyprinus asiaticus]|uniref:C-C motif chemokine 22-like n=1 Tax=Myxocyprinus asiaticus TaxID=70543 RepID=UPI00222254FB|nr:C-C motif chemokine 22-like [Myxocyprinus asiaticus]